MNSTHNYQLNIQHCCLQHRYVEIRIFKSGSNPKIFKMAGDNSNNNGFNMNSLPKSLKYLT